MTQTAQEIEKAFEVWFDTEPVLPAYNWDNEISSYTRTVFDWRDLICYLRDDAEKDSDGIRRVAVPGVAGMVGLYETKGGMDEGTYAHAVLEIVYAMSDNRHFMIDGWYRSHDGHYYEGPFHEVRAIQRLVDDWANV